MWHVSALQKGLERAARLASARAPGFAQRGTGHRPSSDGQAVSVCQPGMSAKDLCGALSGLVSGLRTTHRALNPAMQHVAFEIGGEAGRRVLRCFQIQTSGDTLIRIVRRTALVQVDEARIIGIDDWALKKGRDYGTLIIDLEQHRVVDVLRERTTQVVSDWLQCRDR